LIKNRPLSINYCAHSQGKVAQQRSAIIGANGLINIAALLASDLAKDLRNSSIKSHLWCQFTAKWHSPSRASHVDFETRYNRTRVMTSWAFAAARFSVGDFLL